MRFLTAIPSFFVSSWVLMLVAGDIHADVGIRAFGYVTAMVVTAVLWFAVAPPIGVASRRTWKRASKKKKE